MKTILVISPDYLSAIYKESKKYSFMIQGYGSFELACAGITKLNCKDLLGVVYVSYTTPKLGTRDYKFMKEFLNYCEIMEESKSILFVTQITAPEIHSLARDFSNVSIHIAESQTLITDAVINRKVFGFILKQNYKPFDLMLDVKSERAVEETEDWKMQRSFIVNSQIQECLQRIEVLDTPELTLENDTPFQHFMQSGNHLLLLIRKKLILDTFGVRDDILLNTITQKINELEDPVEWSVLLTLTMNEGGFHV